MDGATSISKLIKLILDLISKILVLTSYNVQLFIGLIKTSLQSETFSIQVTALRLASLKFRLHIISLGFPFSNNLFKVLASLLSNDSSSMSTLILKGHLLKLSSKTVLGLFSGANLTIKSLNCLFSFSNSGGNLSLDGLKLINSAKTLSLKLRFPQLNFSLGLGESLKNIILLLSLLINLHLKILSFSAKVLVLSKEGSTVSGLTISKSLSILKLSAKRDLVLLESSNSILSLLNLSVQILVLNLELLLGGVSFIESSGKLIKLLVGLNNGSLGHLAVLFHVRSSSHGLFKTRSGLLEVSLH